VKAFFIIILFSVLAFTGNAQSAQVYFNNSANYYVKDKKVEAMQTVRDGLAKYPGDEKLTALAEKMKQEKKEQEKKEQEKKEQEKKDQQQKDQEKKDEQEQQKKEQEKKEQEQKDKQEKNEKKDPEKDQQQSEEEKKEEQKQNQPQPPPDKFKEMKISEEKAKMLLDAMKNQERQYLQQNKRKATKSKDKSKPDW
jgi:hypothetical protein